VEVFVGTSGWLYDWNEEQSLDWYVGNSGLNAVELNASFYRFPFPNQVKAWSEKGSSLRWAIKVNRLVTHIHMLNYKAGETYEKFIALFKPLDKIVDFYLLQMPPNFSAKMSGRVEDFSKSFNGKKMAFEFRNRSWYEYNFDKLNIDGTVVSPDSPDVQGAVWIKNGTIYMRFHGRGSWYSYKYSNREIDEAAKKCAALSPRRLYAFFNNDHNMLRNARCFQSAAMGR